MKQVLLTTLFFVLAISLVGTFVPISSVKSSDECGYRGTNIEKVHILREFGLEDMSNAIIEDHLEYLEHKKRNDASRAQGDYNMEYPRECTEYKVYLF